MRARHTTGLDSADGDRLTTCSYCSLACPSQSMLCLKDQSSEPATGDGHAPAAPWENEGEHTWARMTAARDTALRKGAATKAAGTHFPSE